MEPSTLDPRQKDRLSLEGPHETPRFWKPAFASKRSAWLARLVEQCWHVSIKGVFHTERTVRSVTRISIFSGWCLFWSARFALQCKKNFFELFWNVRLFLLWRAVCFKIIFVSCTTGSPSAVCVGSGFRGHLSISVLCQINAKSLKDMKSSCLSICTGSIKDNEGRYFLHYYMWFGPLLFEFYHMYSNRILFTVGNVDRDIGRYSGRQSVDSRSILGRHSVDSRSTLGRYSVDSRST